MHIKNSIPVAALIFAATLTSPLNAQTQEAVSHSVSYADLNLARAEGRDMLDRRIAVAVRRVCDDPSSKDMASNRALRRCRSDALATATRQRDAVVAEYGDRHASDTEMAMRNR